MRKATVGMKLFLALVLIVGLLLLLSSHLALQLFGLVSAGIGGWLLVHSLRSRIFDPQLQLYWAGRARRPPHPENDKVEQCRFDEIHAIQLLAESVNGETSYISYEINLVLNDGRRLNVSDYGHATGAAEDAELLARFLDVPVWSSPEGSPKNWTAPSAGMGLSPEVREWVKMVGTAYIKAVRIKQLLFAFLWMGCVVAIAVTKLPALISDITLHDHLIAQESELSSLEAGTKLLFETRVTDDNKALVRGLVLGCREEWVSPEDEYSSWEVQEEYNQDLYTFMGDTTVLVAFEKPCPNGDYARVENPADDNERWVGVTPGQLLTIQGELSSTDPLKVRATNYYIGTIESERSNTWVGAAIFFSALISCFAGGIGFFVFLIRRAKV